MENATDALKMAFGVLVFVLALSVSINAFSEVRTTAQTIMEYSDREYDTTYVEESGTTERLVGIESIIPTIYKAYKENYKIVFDERLLGDDGVYKKRDETGNYKPVYTIDLEKEVLGSDTQKENFILAIIYGKSGNIAKFNNISQELQSNLKISLNDEGIYGKIKGKVVKEYLGVYYQEEAGGEEGIAQGSSTPDANKTIKRVITYKPQ